MPDDVSIKDLEASHTTEAVRQRLDNGKTSKGYLRDFIYGAIDGAVTTFAVVSGVAGAGLSNSVVIILGIANLVADGFSMAASNFLGTRAEEQAKDKARLEEENQVDLFPEGEREEIRQIFGAKGFSGAELERIVDVITSDKKRWVDTMIQEELGYSLLRSAPLRAAAVTFLAFIAVGAIPLCSYFLNVFAPGLIADPFFASCILTACAFALVGAFKSRFVMQNWLWSATETLIIGGIAAVIAYTLGVLLKGFGAGV